MCCELLVEFFLVISYDSLHFIESGRKIRALTRDITFVMPDEELDDVGPSSQSTTRHSKSEFLCARLWRNMNECLGGDMYRVSCTSRHRKPLIHPAIKRGDINAVKMLVRDGKEDVNVKDDDGNTPLHVAIKFRHARIVKILLGRSDVVVNEMNNAHQTPLQLALAEGEMNIIQLLLGRIDVDVDNAMYDGKSCRDRIKEKYPQVYLFGLLYRRETAEFVELARSNREALNWNGGEYTYLQVASKYGLVEVVRTLLNLGIDPNSRCRNTDPPIVIAAFHGCHGVVEVLLKHEKISLKMTNGINALHALLYGVEKSRSACPDRDHDYRRCLRLFLQDEMLSKVDVNDQDPKGNTILHLAARLYDDIMVKMILRTPVYVGVKNYIGKYALEFVKPSIAEEWLDDCISTNEVRRDKENYAIILDYSKLAPTKSYKYSLSMINFTIFTIGVCESEPLLEIGGVKDLREIFLKHPLLMTFFHLKWQAIRKIFYINLIYYLTFLSLLSLYIFNRFTPSAIFSLPDGSWRLFGFQLVIGLFISTLSIRLFLLFVMTRFSYFTCLDNWLEMSVIWITYRVVFSVDNRVYATLAILISWSEAILIIGRHPKFSTYVEMFKTISVNFSKVLLWFSILIFAFAFSFFVLYCDEEPTVSEKFATMRVSIFRAFMMMKGELNSASFPLNKHDGFGYAIFLLFVFFISIVFVSLLNGLAVSDIQHIKNDAELVGIMSRVKLIALIESMVVGEPFPQLGIFDLLVEKKAYVFPNLDHLVLFDMSSMFDVKKYEKSLCGELFVWRMDADIVESCKKILQKRELAGAMDCGEIIKKCDLKAERYESQLQDFQSASNRSAELLTEIKDIL